MKTNLKSIVEASSSLGCMVGPKPKPKPVDYEKEVFGDFEHIESKYIKTYVTRKALAKALYDAGCRRHHNALVVCNAAGRWTAIIPVAPLQGNLTAFSGFMKLG